ncbi:MAG: dCTP deaminase [Phycisphaerales bacterium]|nr:dCTP deaminase [Phycisphaerales bacterium]
MVLSDVSIRRYLQSGRLRVFPLADDSIRPASICLHLGPTVLVPASTDTPIDPSDAATYPSTESRNIDVAHGFTMPRSHFLLASTVESVGLSNEIAGCVMNISGLARLGVNVAMATHVSPGFGESDPRPLTLEIYNVGAAPVTIRAGMRICHLVVSSVEPAASIGYDMLFPRKYRGHSPSESQFGE